MSEQQSVELSFRTVGSMKEIGRERWQDLPATSRSGGNEDVPYNPFLDFDFLDALEESGSVAERTGWQPRHAILESADGELLAATPCYLKGHSQGEYIFDHGWADAFERAGGDYYPKLLSAIPFTPATGPRLLARENDATLRSALGQAVARAAERSGISSAHFNFVTETDAAVLEDSGYLLRLDRQFHFRNEGYATYDDFLATLSSRKRKALKRERREANAVDGLTIEWLTGSDVTEEAWDAFFAFYMDTGSRKWGRPYLNRRFFSLVGERMADDVLLVMAKRDGRYIAGALNLIGGDTIYGRHWGCAEHHPFLHFEICYHQAIDFAIERGLRTVEAGAQGEHKLARGYAPTLTRSCHFIPHPGFRRAVADYLEHERREVMLYAETLDAYGPFRRGERTDAGNETGFAIRNREVEETE